MSHEIPKVLVVIVNYNGGVTLVSCIKSVMSQNVSCIVVVVDNASSDNSEKDALTRFPEIKLIESKENLGYGAAVNVAASLYYCEYILVLNPDIILQGKCIEKLMHVAINSPGVVGPTLITEPSIVSSNGCTINHLGTPTECRHFDKPLFVQGCVMLITREVFDVVGGFDSRYFLFVEDVEICWRVLLAGYSVEIAKNAQAVHLGGASIGGGYIRSGEPYLTNSLRISLRERNSIALMISCAPKLWLVFVLPALVVRMGCIGFISLLSGSSDTFFKIYKGIWWNIKFIKPSIERRKSLARVKQGDINARSRIINSPLMIKTVFNHGFPKIK